jgi:thiamine pyrophosphate-dependent acetolactate synthase large subunit-like protein
MGLGGFQETDQLPIFSKITKYQGHVSSPARMAELTARCLDFAMSEGGPTQLNIPRNHFYGEADYTIAVPKRIQRGPGADESIGEAVKLLIKAKFPVIVSRAGLSCIAVCRTAWRSLGISMPRWLILISAMTASRAAIRSGAGHSAIRARRLRGG